MTKTKADKKPPVYAHLSKSPRNRKDMYSEDGSSNAHSSQMPRHALHVTTQQTLVSAQKIVSEVSKHKDVHSQPPCRRSSASTAAISHTVSGGKEVKPERGKRSENVLRSAPGTQKNRIKLSVPRKLSDAKDISADCSAVNLSSTDSSSETSDCTEENKILNIAQSIDIIEMSNGETDRQKKKDSREKLPEFTDKCSNFHSSFDNTTVTPALGFEDRSISPGDERSLISIDSRLNTSASATFSDLTGDVDNLHKDLLREIDDLRSENEYLKDEVEELRSEVLEMRDVYTEEDVHHLQELRQQLDQANKACRILQYRLRKAERRSLRVAQTGQVDGELIRTLEHDIRVAKSVSLRLHSELEVVQKKNVQLEQENEGLREQLQNLEVTKQVLQTELDKSRENSLRRRSLRSTTSKSEKKFSLPDDSGDLICQLHFAKEELSLMCKKLAKTAVECESMREELARYRLLYGDVDASQAAAGTTNSAHTREAEVKVHLRLVEEEATLLSRRIVELEVENRGLLAEMSELQERAGRSQKDEDELMEAAGECLAVPKGGTSSEYCGFEERTGSHEHSEGVVSEGVVSEGVVSEGVVSEGVVSEGVVSEGVVSEGCPLGQNLKEGPIGLDREVLEGLVKSAESPECGRNVPFEETCNLSLKDQEAILAIHDQATLVRSAVEFLTTPAKNGLSPTSVCSFPYFSKVDAQCKSLTYGLEVLQEQLRTLVAKVETLVKSELTDHKSRSTRSDKFEDTNIEPVLQADKQVAQQCPIEEVVHVSSHTWELTGKQDSLVLMALQLRCFLQQWRHGERPTAECKSMFEMDFQKDLYCQMEAELHGSKKTCKTHQQCHNQVCRNLLSNLRAALQDLGCELQEEYLASQHIAQQFAQAKAAWTVECTELKCIIGKLESTSDNVEAKGSPDLKTALQKDHVEKLQQRLAESYAAVMNMSQQLKVCERNWKCERQEFLKRLNQACQDWHKLSNNKVSYGFRTHQIGEETMRKCSLHMVDPKAAQSEQMSNKNWIYLTQEAALIDREGPCKTWDCSIMPSSFPDLTIKKETAQKSHTAPERTSLRIYYSPPSARRIHLYAEKLDADKCERPAEKQEPCCSRSPHEHICGNIASDYDSRQGTLPFECQRATECDLSAFARSNTSGFQPFDSSFPSYLPFSGLEVTANLSDDMKEITANVLQSSYPKPLDRGKWRGSGSHIVEVVSTGTQTHALPQVNSVALQTEGLPNMFAGKHWSPRVTSFVSGRHQQIPTSLERIPVLSERSCLSSTSPKLQEINSASSPFSPTSLTSNSSNSSTLSTLSSSSSSTSFSRQDVPKDHGLWPLPHNSSGSSAFTHSSSAGSSSASGSGSEKPAERKSMRIHKYGLVQEFFHNVCGRGEKPKSRGEKAPVVRRDHVGQAKLKKTEGPPSRIPTVQPVRSDSITKIVNRRFIKQGQKDELRPGQTQSQSECQCQNSKTSLSKDKCRGPVTLEDRSCECRCRTLSSCFARASCTNLHHARGHCKLHPHRCPTAAGGKEDLLSL